MRAIARRTVILAAMAAAALTLAACGDKGAGKAEGDMSLGDPNAKVKVIEYASVTCSHCAAWNEEVFPAFKAKYIDTGKVHYTFREFPTAPMPVAAAGFLLARCAGEDKYFEVVDAIMRSQQEMFESRDPRGTLLRVAQSVGMNEAEFEKCVSDEAALKEFTARTDAAIKAGIDSTPTFVIDGEKFVGAQSMAQLDAAIGPKLK